MSLKFPRLSIFQTIELSHLIKEDVQVVPEGVWLRLKPEGVGQLELSLHKLATSYQSEQKQNESLNLEFCGKQQLSASQAYTLLPSQFFQLHLAPGSESIAGNAEFLTIPNLSFNKKFNSINGLGQPHSEVAYFKAYYSHLHPEYGQRPLKVLDIGSGRGRNAVIFAGDAEHEYQVLGLEKNPDSLAAWNSMAQTKGLKGKLQSQQVDLNSWREAPLHDMAMAIVSLQFLQAQAARELLHHCMEKAHPGAMHLAVFPIASQHASIIWPGGFHFLPQSDEVKYWYMRQGWSILEYRESYGHLGKLTPDGLPLRGLFATLIAQKTQGQAA